MLPREGRVSLDQVASGICQAGSALGLLDSVVAKCVIVKIDENRWVHHATVVHVGMSENSSDYLMGSLRLVAEEGRATEFVTGSALRDFVTATQVRTLGEAPSLQDVAGVNRHAGHNRWSKFPCWQIDLHTRVHKGGAFLREGPFFSLEVPRVFETVGAAAAEWLGDQGFLGIDTVADVHRVILPDRRAYFSALAAEGNELRAEVSSLESLRNVYCSAVSRDFDGNYHRQWVRVENGVAHLKFGRSVRALNLYLLDAESVCYDQYRESENYASWGRSLYNEDRLSRDALYRNLRYAIENGEGESVEFKEWINVTPRDQKSLELLETTVAFSNARGGAIYIGVDRHLRVVGTQRYLIRTYQRSCDGDLERMRDSYVNDLRRVMSEGVSPPLSPTYEWIQDAGHWVLRISVDAGTEKPYGVVETGEWFIRRGGSNRKATRLELEQMFRRGEA